MRRIPSILLLLCFAAVGSGALSRLHAHVHEVEDQAHQTAHARLHEAGIPHEHHREDPRPTHDETNCELHALLRAPMTAAAAAPIVLAVHQLVERLDLAPRPLVAFHTLSRIDCRGPPSF